MSTQETADRLVMFCRSGQYHEAVDHLYHADIVSVESAGPPGVPLEQKGIQAIKGKVKWWEETFQVHGGMVSDPIVSGEFFVVKMTLDVTNKHTATREFMSELCVYQVKEGKIVHERFVYGA